MDPKGVKYPYLQAEPLPPNRHQTNRKYWSKFYYQQKVGLSVCSTLWLNKTEAPSDEGSVGSLLSGVASPALLLLSLVWEEEGVLGRHLGAPVSGWLETPDPISLAPDTRELFLDSAAAALGPSSSSEVIRSR